MKKVYEDSEEWWALGVSEGSRTEFAHEKNDSWDDPSVLMAHDPREAVRFDSKDEALAKTRRVMKRLREQGDFPLPRLRPLKIIETVKVIDPEAKTDAPPLVEIVPVAFDARVDCDGRSVWCFSVRRPGRTESLPATVRAKTLESAMETLADYLMNEVREEEIVADD